MAGEDVAITLQVKNDQLARELRKSTAEVKRLENSLREVGNTSVRSAKQIDSVAKSTGSMFQFTKAFAALAIVGYVTGAARAFSQYASAIQGANNQLRSVSKSSEGFQRLSAGTLQIANDTGTSFEAVANSVARFTRALADYGGTADQALIITDTMSKAFLVTGASTVEATSALQQLGQALESGLLSGDEFRSLRENAPLAAKAIAKSLGVSIGELRKLSEQGKLTTDVVANALIAANGEINKAAEGIPLTLDRSLTVASNILKDFVADSDGLNDALSTVGEGAVAIAGQIATIGAELFSVDTAFSETTQQVLGLTGPVDLLVRALQGLIAGLYTIIKVVKFVIDTFVTFGQVTLGIFLETFGSASKIIRSFGTAIKDGITAAFRGDGDAVAAAVATFFSEAESAVSNATNGLGKVLGSAYEQIGKDTFELVDGVSNQWLSLGQTVAATPIVFDPAGSLKKTAEDAKAADKEAKKLLDTFTKLAAQLQDYAVSQRSAPEQSLAAYEELIAKVEQYRAAAKLAGVAVDEALAGEVTTAAARQLNKDLEDQAQQWRDIVPPVNEAEAAARRYIDKMREIEEVGILLGKTTEEIRAQQAEFDAALDAELVREYNQAWIEVGKTVIDAFGGAFQAIVDGSASAKDALRDLLEQMLLLIAKAVILSALSGGNFLSGLTSAIGGARPAGGGPDPAGGGGFSGFSGRANGSTVRIYNQGGGLVNTQTRSNGDVDVMIGALATAVSRGGNNFDQVMRRTYGLDRRGV